MGARNKTNQNNDSSYSTVRARSGDIQNYRKTPERGIPPSHCATRRCTKVHLGFCLRFSTLIGQTGRVPLFGSGPRRYIRSRLFRLAVTAFWRALTCFLAEKRQAKADLSSGHSHDRTAFEPFAPDISEQPDPNLTDLFDIRNHGSQHLSARHQHTGHLVVTRTHAHTTRDSLQTVEPTAKGSP